MDGGAWWAPWGEPWGRKESNMTQRLRFTYSAWVKNPSACRRHQETRFQSLDWEVPLKEEMAAHSSALAWTFPWTEKPCALQC